MTQWSPNELLIEVYDPHRSELGGWHVGTASGVRVTHIPTGCVAACVVHRTQHKNKDTALEALEYMLLERKQ